MPHWNIEYQILYEGDRKSLGVKKTHRFAECQDKTLGKGGLFAEC